MPLGLRVRLSLMMLLEFFVWGAWLPVLSVYLGNALDHPTSKGLGFSDIDAGLIYGMLPLASIFMPLLAGQITDRWVPNQIFLGLAHLIGGISLLVIARSTDASTFKYGMFIWSLAYAPTISLTNSLAFAHVKNPETDFGLIRVFGTIGWILAGLVLWGWRSSASLAMGGNDCLYLSGLSGILMGVFCFTLPNTPPARHLVSPWAFLKALGLLKDPRILVFLIISFVVGTELPFYFQLTGPFLQNLGVKTEDLSAYMSIGQAAEIGTMLLLPLLLKAFGPRKTLFIGILAWPIRYLIFSVGTPFGLVAASLTLHGLCFVCFFVVAFIYMDSVSPPDIKASAQGLLTLTIYGLGMWVGSIFAGLVKGRFTVDNNTNWTYVFLVPSGITILCAVVLMMTFPKGSIRENAAMPEAAH